MPENRTTDGGKWEGFAYERAVAWCRVFIDYPPRFPGATVMNYAYRAVREGRPVGLLEWPEAARAGESVGMTSDQYYTLKLTLSVITPDRYPRHAKNFTFRNRDGWKQTPMDLAEWGLWVELVNSGSTPLTATRLILSGGTEGPRGLIIRLEDGVISTTDDA